MSFATEALAKVEAMLLGKADKDVQEYHIAGRVLKHYAIHELMTLRDRLRAEVKQEQAEAALTAAGKKKPRRVLYHF